MPLPGFDEVFRRAHAAADAAQSPIRLAVVGGDDATVIPAMAEVAHLGWVRPVLYGDAAATSRLAESLDVAIEGTAKPIELIDSINPAVDAVAAVRRGEVDALTKGRIATPDFMRAILDRESGLRTGTTIGQIVLMEIPKDERRFLMTDTGITIAPTLGQSADLLRSCIEVAGRLGEPHPNIAVLAATEKPTDSMPETRLAERLRSAEGLGTDAQPSQPNHSNQPNHSDHSDHSDRIRGPLSFDLAYSRQSAERKSIDGTGIGAADIMLFPNLLSANLTVKAMMFTAHCRFAGMLCGVTCPVAFMSRSDDVITRIRSVAWMTAMNGDHRSMVGVPQDGDA